MALPLPVTPSYPHVEFDENGVPLLSGTTMKVAELVMAQRAYGWSPEEIHFQYPHLALSQIHSALAYYWDHQDQIDRDIERRTRFAEQARAQAGPSPFGSKSSACDVIP